MKHTDRQSSTETLADLLRSMDSQFAVTITYVKRSGNESVRTIEIFDALTTSEGQIILQARDLFAGGTRSFHPERIRTYTLHHGLSFALVGPPNGFAGPKAVLRSTAQVIARELGRDYWSPRNPAPDA